MKTNGKFYIYDMVTHDFFKVAGVPVTFKGYEGLDLFTHGWIHGTDYYCVSEGKTGLRVALGNTRREACINAGKLLKCFDACGFQERIEAAMKTTGLSPRYAGAGDSAVAAAPSPPSSTVQAQHPAEPVQNKITGPSGDLTGCG